MGIDVGQDRAYLFYKTPEWLWIREQVLVRDGYACVRCSSVIDLVVHHDKRLRTNWELRLDEGNLFTLCSRCHKEEHRLDARYDAWISNGDVDFDKRDKNKIKININLNKINPPV